MSKINKSSSNGVHFIYHFQCPAHPEITYDSEDHIYLGDYHSPGPFYCEKCHKYYVNYYKFVDEGREIAIFHGKPLVVTKKRFSSQMFKRKYTIFRSDGPNNSINNCSTKKTKMKKRQHCKITGKQPVMNLSSNWGRSQRPKQPWS